MPLTLKLSLTEKERKFSVCVCGICIKTYDNTRLKLAVPHDKKEKDQGKTKKDSSDLFRSFKMILEVSASTLKHLHFLPRISKLCFCVRFGLSDAAKTGVAAGSVYGLVYGIVARLHRSKRVQITQVSVNPDFQTPVFSLDCSGIIRWNLAHIMGITVVVLAVVFKYKIKH